MIHVCSKQGQVKNFSFNDCMMLSPSHQLGINAISFLINIEAMCSGNNICLLIQAVQILDQIDCIDKLSWS